MEFVKKYKSLLIASAVGLILSIAVASDESSYYRENSAIS